MLRPSHSRSIGPAEDGLARLFEELYDAVLLIDTESGAILAANRAAVAMLRYSADELSRMTPSEIHPHEIPRLESFLRTVRENGRWTAGDLSCRTKDGHRVPAEIRASTLEMDGRVCILAIVRDRRTDLLAELGQSVRKLTHDLRNTLSTAQLLGDRLIDHEDAAVRRSAETIARSIERAVRMCRQTLEVGRATEAMPKRERFLLAEVMADVVAAAGSPEASGVTVRSDAAHRVALDADFDQVFRILLNLVRNAGDAGAREVVVSGISDPTETVIDVVDDGPGLPEAVRDRLLADEPEPSGFPPGGLGLVIAKELASNHGGGLSLVETGPSGTTFRIVLPAGD